MERDFLGLGSKKCPITVKEEDTSESSRDSAPNRGMNWSFSNKAKASASSQFLSFRPSHEDRHGKSGNYHMPPSGSFMPSSVADVYDSNRKAPYSSVQGVRMFPNLHQEGEPNAVSMSVPSFQSHHYAPGGRSFISNSNNTQSLSGVPIMAPPISILPAPSSIVGTTEIRSSSKPIGSPAQLTIFYAGSVCVYDDISPDKAKAIMLLAGNGSSMPQAFSPSQSPQHAVHHTPASVDSSAMPQAFSPFQTPQHAVHHTPASVDSSAMPRAFSPFQTPQHAVHHTRASVGSSAMPQAFSPSQTPQHAVHHTRASADSSAMPRTFMPTVSYLSPEAGRSTNGFGAATLTRGLTSTSHNIQTNASCSTTVIAPTVALPLARKASLARFLEKRKERVTSVSPYSLDKKSSTDCHRSMSECISSSLSSAT